MLYMGVSVRSYLDVTPYNSLTYKSHTLFKIHKVAHKSTYNIINFVINFQIDKFSFQPIIADHSGDKCAKIITITLSGCKISIIFHFEVGTDIFYIASEWQKMKMIDM